MSAFLLEIGDEDTYAINGSDAAQVPTLYYQTPLRKDVLKMAEVDLKIRQLFAVGKSKELNALLSQYHVGYTKMNGRAVFRKKDRSAKLVCPGETGG